MKQCSNADCFVTRDFEAIPVRGSFGIYLQATQSIAEPEIDGQGIRASLLRRLGANSVPGYPNPDRQEILRQDQFKTTNAVWLSGSITNGKVTLKDTPPPVTAGLGLTSLFGLDIGGKKFVNDPLIPTTSGYEHCLLGAIARPIALANLGRRIVIGSRIAFDVRLTGPDSAIITPHVTYSRFPTTFIWLERDLTHGRAAPLYGVLQRCEKWSNR